MSRKDLANAIRALSMDAVQKANSGHPGAPMGMADIAEVLWNDFLKHNPTDPTWYDRDRFILSNGHASMLLYSLLHLTGYDLPLEELKNFRQLHSKTPGHPEIGYTPGVETTTGPLGQGLANAVGLAIAERTLGAQFNRPDHEIVDHYTYVFMGDGCLMEGISHEVCSLAGTLGLGKLIGFYDHNGISIDGETEGWFTDDTAKRFEAYHWHVVHDIDGHDPEAVKKAILEAQSVKDKPSLIICRTVIGFGSPNKAGKEESHGAALGEEEVALTRQKLGWHHPAFEIPKEIYRAWDGREKGEKAQQQWQEKFAAYEKAYPELAAEFTRRMSGGKPDIILIATGSEMEITLQAAEKLTGEGHNVRVVSLPSTDIFDAQDEAYRESVLPAHVTARVAVEAGIADYWYKYVGLKGAIIGMTGYGESAPADKLFPYFGFTVENIVEKARRVLNIKG
ncbi:hypothetical protein EKF03_07120 [Salmonella enterica]|nr:hypothetical protein [Salmonella enterica]EAR5510250.1 hypothetical protein [Salmonella enterica]EEN0652671.1 hypothetical protein [Salmonella enterica subsp. enterica serovar Typhimurium]